MPLLSCILYPLVPESVPACCATYMPLAMGAVEVASDVEPWKAYIVTLVFAGMGDMDFVMSMLSTDAWKFTRLFPNVPEVSWG